MSFKQKFTADSSKMFVGSILSTLFSVARSYMIASALGPTLLGIWSIFTTLLTYNLQADFGMLEGMNKLLPYLRGKGDLEELEKVKNSTFTILCLVGFFVSLILFATALWFEHSGKTLLALGLKLLPLVAAANLFYNFFVTLMRTEKKFGLISLAISGFSLFSFLLLLLFLHMLPSPLISVLLTFFSAYAFITLLLILIGQARVKLFLSKEILKKVLQTGFPLIVLGIGLMIYMSLDKWLVITFLGKEQLGLYAIGITISGLLFSSTSVVSYTLFPKLSEQFGETHDPKHMNHIVYKTMLVMSYLLSPITALSALTIPFLLSILLPTYVKSISLSTLFCFSTYFLVIGSIGGNTLISIGQQKKVLYCLLLALITNVVLNYSFLKGGFGIEGVALGTGLSYLIYGGGNSFMALRVTSLSPSDARAKSITILAPFLLTLSFVSLIIKTHSSILIGNTLLNMSVLVLFSIVITFYLSRQAGIYHDTLNAVKRLSWLGERAL